MSSKIIIHNKAEGLLDLDAIDMVSRVIANGKVSGTGSNDTEQYCYASTFKPSDPSIKYKYIVACFRKKGVDTYTFKVYREH